MKKICSILLSLLLLFCLISCGNAKNMTIENYTWTLRTVMSSSDESSPLVLATNEESAAYPDATIVAITLIAKDGALSITDSTHDERYTGTYRATGRTPAGTEYEITIEGQSGYACVAPTQYADGSSEPTLPITLRDYSLYFYAP